MTPRERAKSLLDKYYVEVDACDEHFDNQASLCNHQAKQCAIICVEQIIESLEVFGYQLSAYDDPETGKMKSTNDSHPNDYWRQVLEILKTS